jgi:hypothetical protein
MGSSSTAAAEALATFTSFVFGSTAEAAVSFGSIDSDELELELEDDDEDDDDEEEDEVDDEDEDDEVDDDDEEPLELDDAMDASSSASSLLSWGSVSCVMATGDSSSSLSKRWLISRGSDVETGPGADSSAFA